jgi:hypothetical protein
MRENTPRVPSPRCLHDRANFFKYMSASTALLVPRNHTLRWSSPEQFDDQFDVTKLATPLLRPTLDGKKKAGTQGAKPREFRPSGLERETGFEPATLSLGS